MTSSTKSVVHNVLQCHQQSAEPRPQVIGNTYTKFCETWTCGFGDMQADRQKNRQTNPLIAVLCIPLWGK